MPVLETAAQSGRSPRPRQRLPRGFGQITEIKTANLRNPFRVMVTVGRDSGGKPIIRLLKPQAYFPTYNDAYAALAAYNRDPYDLEKTITVQELYGRWFAEYQKTVVSTRLIECAWQYCGSVYRMPVAELRARHIKFCMEEGTAVIRGKLCHTSAGTKNRIKTLFNLMLDYALEYEVVDRNYSRTFKLTADTIKEIQTVKREHIAFTDGEMSRLWEAVGVIPGADLVLIQCYSGWRPQELGLLELENVDLKSWTFRGGMKTEAGEDRLVPIHPRIRPLVAARYREAVQLGSRYLLNWPEPGRWYGSVMLSYQKYRNVFLRVVRALELNPAHRPHDCRTHFVTAAKRAGVDEYAIKYIVGHKISDLTERVYTKREFTWLVEEMAKIR